MVARTKVGSFATPSIAGPMRILSWNLLRRNGAGVGDISRLVDVHHPDLVLMQEATAAIDALPRRLGGNYVRETMHRRSHGPAAWSLYPFTSTTVTMPLATRLDLPVPVFRLVEPRISLVVRIDVIELATVHLDHGQLANRRQLRHLLSARPELHALIGDYNALGPTNLPGFTDVGPRCTTHRAYGIAPVRIDRCLVRKPHEASAIALPYGASDHRPILIDLT